MNQEERFATEARSLATSMASIYYALLSWRRVFQDRQYAQKITDEQLTAIGLTRAEVAGMLTFVNNLEAFMVEQENMKAISMMRNDI